MKFEAIKEVAIKDLAAAYYDLADKGVWTMNGQLEVRPAFQREFVYKDAQRAKVLETVRENRPLGIFYWSKEPDGHYCIVDGQQRTISICEYVNNKFPIDWDGVPKFYNNLTETQCAIINNYKILVYCCEGTEEERLDWFRTINIAGVVLNDQELLNAAYVGPWLTDAKVRFSRSGCAVEACSKGYVNATINRQEYLSTALKWIVDRDGLKTPEEYMAIHQHDASAEALALYYREVIDWAKRLFPTLPAKIAEKQDWGLLYNRHKNDTYSPAELEKKLNELLADEEITKPAGIIPYLLSPRTAKDERSLSLRAFPEQMMRRKYVQQGGVCACCGKAKDFSDMQGDHCIPWSRGGKTVESNLQMLCKACNAAKSNG